MKIRIYIGTRGNAYGGAENTVAVLASALRELATVEIASSLLDFNLERLAHVSGVALQGITSRYVPLDQTPPPRTNSNPFGELKQQRAWNAQLSQDCELFLNIGNVVPPFSHAQHGAIRIFFPFGTTPYTKRPGGRGLGRVVREARHLLRQREWQQRMKTYDFKVANSRFTQKWTRRYWGVESEVIHPPVDIDFAVREKIDLIVSVGRFTVSENRKKQLEMMQTFRRMTAAQSAGWEYITVGGVVEKADQIYFESVAREGEGIGGQAIANLKRPELKFLLERSKIFWHGAGYGEDEDKNPGGAEHFGQSTVEAMAAGCVPVVINRGGQPEIVEHGVNGYVWDTLEELHEYTQRLVDDPALWRRMSEAARAHSTRFSRAAFAQKFTQLLAPVCR